MYHGSTLVQTLEKIAREVQRITDATSVNNAGVQLPQPPDPSQGQPPQGQPPQGLPSSYQPPQGPPSSYQPTSSQPASPQAQPRVEPTVTLHTKDRRRLFRGSWDPKRLVNAFSNASRVLDSVPVPQVSAQPVAQAVQRAVAQPVAQAAQRAVGGIRRAFRRR